MTPGLRTPDEPHSSRAGGTPRRRRVAFGTLAIVAAVAAGPVLAACSSSTSTPTTTAPVHSATIAIRNFKFVPATLRVSPGAVIKVFNEDQVTHTLTASHGQFNTGGISAGQSASFTAPTAAGTFDYICTIHAFMHGTLVVS
jgi:plastocyanin